MRETRGAGARDRMLSVRVILATRQVGGAYGGIVELLALTGQWRETSGKPAAKVVPDGNVAASAKMPLEKSRPNSKGLRPRSARRVCYVHHPGSSRGGTFAPFCGSHRVEFPRGALRYFLLIQL